MAAGTYFGGWRIINTLGHKIAKLESPQGFAAETATAATLGIAAHFGFPISTTHTISGAILGAGAVTNPKLVNWKIVKQILLAWLITIPCAAAMGALAQLITRLPYGDGIIVLLAALIIALIFLTRHWTRESLAQVSDLLSILQQPRNVRKDSIKKFFTRR
jgi:PiT family inorganic phosphate transporter